MTEVGINPSPITDAKTERILDIDCLDVARRDACSSIISKTVRADVERGVKMKVQPCPMPGTTEMKTRLR